MDFRVLYKSTDPSKGTYWVVVINMQYSSSDAVISAEYEGEEDCLNSKESNFEVASLHPEDQIQKSLREITSHIIRERRGRYPYVP